VRQMPGIDPSIRPVGCLTSPARKSVAAVGYSSSISPWCRSCPEFPLLLRENATVGFADGLLGGLPLGGVSQLFALDMTYSSSWERCWSYCRRCRSADAGSWGRWHRRGVPSRLRFGSVGLRWGGPLVADWLRKGTIRWCCGWPGLLQETWLSEWRLGRLDLRTAQPGSQQTAQPAQQESLSRKFVTHLLLVLG
jgi:hypothetical protein